jgi:uncharacterized protein with FMN-binding domain
MTNSSSSEGEQMRRAALTLVATVAGLVLLLGFKSHGGGVTSRQVALAPATAGQATPSAGAPTTPTPTPTATKRAGHVRSTTPTRRTVTGDTVETRYGPVQVRVTVSGKRITNITAVSLPTGQGRDIQIDQEAVPQLRSEALTAQSAHIDIVSGATYTSDGYAQSLQSALDRAGA